MLRNAIEEFMDWAKSEHADTCSGIVEKSAEHELAELMRRINFWSKSGSFKIFNTPGAESYRRLAHQISTASLDELRSFMATRKAAQAAAGAAGAAAGKAVKKMPASPVTAEEELSNLDTAMPEFKDPFEEEKKRQEEEAARRAAEPKPEKVYGDKWGDW